MRRKYLALFALFICASAFGVLSVNQEIVAQIKNIYGENYDQVAGTNSLMSAAAANDIDGVRFFSKGGASLINQRNIGGATALHIASREGNFDIAELLIANGADVNIADNEGWTPLMRASIAGAYDIAELLLSKNADASALNSLNESAIFHATYSDCDRCLRQMFERFNFIKMMDQDSLKGQINDAFVTARSHENKNIQSILEQYLDQIVKMSMLVRPSVVSEDLGNISIGEKNQLDLVIKNNSKNEFVEHGSSEDTRAMRKKQIKKIKGKFKFVGSVEEGGEKSIAENPNKFTPISSPKSAPKDVAPAKQKSADDNGSIFLQNSRVDDKSVIDILKSKKFRFSQGPSALPQQSVKAESQKPKTAKDVTSNKSVATDVAPIPPMVNSFKLMKGPSGQNKSEDLGDKKDDEKKVDQGVSQKQQDQEVETAPILLSLDSDKAIAEIGKALDQSSSVIVTETAEKQKKKSFKFFKGPSSKN